ncbi:MAG: YwqG family protein [Pseudomonadota bacterium]
MTKTKNRVAYGLLLAILAACGDRPDVDTGRYDELAKYYENDVVADYPPEMAEYRQAFDNAAMPIAVADARLARTSVYDSKFLGTPYMPPGFEYPRDPDGRALSFLAQINFDDVPSLPDYPESGILQFYISDSSNDTNQVWGVEFVETTPYDAQAQFELQQQPNYFRVVWHDTVVTDEDKLQTDHPGSDKLELPVMGEAKLSFSEGIGYPVPGDYRFDKIFGAEGYEFFERFGDAADSVFVRYTSHITIDSVAWLGGYAFFTQWDPRYAEPDEDWLLLFEIQSWWEEGGPEVLWGDAGIGAFFIRREDLQARDFSRVLYHWDNH